MKIFITDSNDLLGQKLIINILKHAQAMKKIIAASKGKNQLTKLNGFTRLDKAITELRYDSVSFEEGLSVVKDQLL